MLPPEEKQEGEVTPATRPPCCRLRPVDVEFMKALHEKVNIVPLIAKADCLIPSEIRKLKERVRDAPVRPERVGRARGRMAPPVPGSA